MKCVLLILVLLFVSPLCSAALSVSTSASIGVYPIPASEMREVIIDWLHGEDIRISHENGAAGSFTLECSREREKFFVKIQPYSPLASMAEISGPDVGNSLVIGLKKSMTDYVQNLHSERPVTLLNTPTSVRKHEKAIFCLTANVGGGAVRFSGFAIDHNGLIISTAHDLDSIRDITVHLENGEEVKGKVIKRDALRDLTLIKVPKILSGAIPVHKGRRNLTMGEKIISLVCPANRHGRVLAGIVDEPPAIVSGQPLWQVNMDVDLGDSGGPVFDSEGRLVGVVKGRYRGGWSHGFLIPTNTLREFLGLGGK